MKSPECAVDHAIKATKRHFGASVMSATATLAGASIMASATLLAARAHAPATAPRYHCVVRHGHGEHHGYYHRDLPPSDGYWTHQIRPSPRGVIRPLSGSGAPAEPRGPSAVAHLPTPPPEATGHDGPAPLAAEPSSLAGDETAPATGERTGPPSHDTRSPRSGATPAAGERAGPPRHGIRSARSGATPAAGERAGPPRHDTRSPRSEASPITGERTGPPGHGARSPRPEGPPAATVPLGPALGDLAP